MELTDTLLYLINFISMSTVSLKLRLKQFSFPTLNFTRIHHKARSFVMVLTSYDLISFHCACALCIQCFYIQHWPATTAQLFPFMPERIGKRR